MIVLNISGAATTAGKTPALLVEGAIAGDFAAELGVMDAPSLPAASLPALLLPAAAAPTFPPLSPAPEPAVVVQTADAAVLPECPLIASQPALPQGREPVADAPRDPDLPKAVPAVAIDPLIAEPASADASPADPTIPRTDDDAVSTPSPAVHHNHPLAVMMPLPLPTADVPPTNVPRPAAPREAGAESVLPLQDSAFHRPLQTQADQPVPPPNPVSVEPHAPAQPAVPQARPDDGRPASPAPVANAPARGAVKADPATMVPMETPAVASPPVSGPHQPVAPPMPSARPDRSAPQPAKMQVSVGPQPKTAAPQGAASPPVPLTRVEGAAVPKSPPMRDGGQPHPAQHPSTAPAKSVHGVATPTEPLAAAGPVPRQKDGEDSPPRPPMSPRTASVPPLPVSAALPATAAGPVRQPNPPVQDRPLAAPVARVRERDVAAVGRTDSVRLPFTAPPPMPAQAPAIPATPVASLPLAVDTAALSSAKSLHGYRLMWSPAPKRQAPVAAPLWPSRFTAAHTATATDPQAPRDVQPLSGSVQPVAMPVATDRQATTPAVVQPLHLSPAPAPVPDRPAIVTPELPRADAVSPSFPPSRAAEVVMVSPEWPRPSRVQADMAPAPLHKAAAAPVAPMLAPEKMAAPRPEPQSAATGLPPVVETAQRQTVPLMDGAAPLKPARRQESVADQPAPRPSTVWSHQDSTVRQPDSPRPAPVRDDRPAPGAARPVPRPIEARPEGQPAPVAVPSFGVEPAARATSPARVAVRQVSAVAASVNAPVTAPIAKPVPGRALSREEERASPAVLPGPAVAARGDVTPKAPLTQPPPESQPESQPEPSQHTPADGLPVAAPAPQAQPLPQRVDAPSPPPDAAVASGAHHLPRHLPVSLVKAASRAEEEGRMELMLDPVELGRVRFELTATSTERVQVNVVVERPETLDLLRRNIETLRAEFREAGFDASTLSFSQWGKGGDAPPDAPAFTATPLSDLTEEPATLAPPAPRNTSRHGLDLRL